MKHETTRQLFLFLVTKVDNKACLGRFRYCTRDLRSLFLESKIYLLTQKWYSMSKSWKNWLSFTFQTCHNADMPTCWFTDMLTYQHADMPTCWHADMWTCCHADMWTCWHTNMLTCHFRHVDMLPCWYVDILTYQHADMSLQTCHFRLVVRTASAAKI